MKEKERRIKRDYEGGEMGWMRMIEGRGGRWDIGMYITKEGIRKWKGGGGEEITKKIKEDLLKGGVEGRRKNKNEKKGRGLREKKNDGRMRILDREEEGKKKNKRTKM